LRHGISAYLLLSAISWFKQCNSAAFCYCLICLVSLLTIQHILPRQAIWVNLLLSYLFDINKNIVRKRSWKELRISSQICIEIFEDICLKVHDTSSKDSGECVDFVIFLFIYAYSTTEYLMKVANNKCCGYLMYGFNMLLHNSNSKSL